MNKETVEREARELHCGGLHCAESVLAAVLKEAGAECGAAPRIATAFGGGVGRSHEEMCGALAGGLMALGCLHGRSKPGANWDGIAELAAEFRLRFRELYGSTRCSEILHALGPQTDMDQCKRLSGVTAGLLATVLEEDGRTRETGRCSCQGS